MLIRFEFLNQLRLCRSIVNEHFFGRYLLRLTPLPIDTGSGTVLASPLLKTSRRIPRRSQAYQRWPRAARN